MTAATSPSPDSPAAHAKSGSPASGPPSGTRPPTAWFSHADCRAHEMGRGHPERPERLDAIEAALASSALAARVRRMSAPLADDAAILRVHSRAYLDEVRDSSPASGHVALDGDTLMNPHTLQAALRAAGAAVAATDAVIGGQARNAFCAIRPPGHHARPVAAMGFCVFNNVAIAARHALEAHGLERVAVIDFDVHHGNGTEEALAGDERAMMGGFFQHPFYPGSGARPAGANMFNVALPAGSGGEAVREAAESVWLPALRNFAPQMIFVSAGFDAHRDDLLGQMQLVEADYAWLTRQLMAVAEESAGGRIVSCLEGGYTLEALAASVLAHVAALAGD